MYIDSNTNKYFKTLKSERARWDKKGRFYYEYVDSLIHFFVDFKKKVLKVDTEKLSSNLPKKADLDYIILSDVLGYVTDIQEFLHDASDSLNDRGRLVITQYSALWEPVLILASKLGMRRPAHHQNWLSMIDLKTFLHLAEFEVVKSGSKMLMPIYIPLVSAFFNKILANIFPFNRLGLIHYVVARKNVKSSDRLNPSISIIVPARNEAGTIRRIVNELPSIGSFTEVILIEGNSTDNTLEEIESVVKSYKGRHKLKFGIQSGKGKGDAVRLGFDMASGDILAIYDADMTVPPEEMIKFHRAIAENRGDFINGSRLVYPMAEQSMRLLNYFGNKFFSFAFSAILGQSLKDTLCGTKVLWREDYENIKANRAFFGDFDPFGDFDLLFGAAKANLKIIDLPIRYRDRVYGETNISRWKHGWLLLQMTVFAAKKLKFR